MDPGRLLPGTTADSSTDVDGSSEVRADEVSPGESLEHQVGPTLRTINHSDSGS